MENVYVTGASGFVGSFLCKALLDKGCKVFGLFHDKREDSTFKTLGLDEKITKIYGDVCDKEIHRRIFSDYKIDTVFHLAAQAIVSNAIKNPFSTFRVNCIGTAALLDACKEFGIKAILVCSTDKIYGEGLGKKEEDKLDAFGVYDCSKVTEEYVARSFYYSYDMPIVISRACNIYGPNDYNSRIVPNTVRKLKKGDKPIIFRGIEGMREYIYVEDVVDAYVKLVENIDKTKGDVFNVGTGESMNQEDMTKLIIKVSGKDVSPVYKTKESIGEIDSQTLNIDKIMKIIDWKPKHSLEEGLKKTWNEWN